MGGIMIRLRKILILLHRYMGIVLSLMFVMWFVTGIGMIYSRGMPRLTPQVRLTRLAPLEMTSVKLTPQEAAERVGALEPRRALLFTVTGRPAYRFGSDIVFADNGEVFQGVDAGQAAKVAGTFMNLPAQNVRYAGELTEPDQWTLTQTRQLPLHKIEVDDAARTELYVSPEQGEVIQVTTRGSRLLSWVSTIPHFLYFTSLRLKNDWWVRAMTWIPAATVVLAALGVVLGIVQFRRRSPHVPYSGWMRWHYVTGLVFGVLTVTWAFSGLLSMEPWAWTERDNIERGTRQAFSGGILDLASFPRVDDASWRRVSGGRPIKEIEFAKIMDKPHYIVRTSPDERTVVGWPDGGHQPYFVSRDPDAARVIVAADSFSVRHEPFATETLVNRLRKANQGVDVLETASLNEYDAYYYSRDGQAPLPVVRVKLADEAKTWVYLDPEVGQVVGHVNRLNRIERWLYNGLHTLDLPFLYYNRPLWDGVVIALTLGGTAVSAIGLFLGIRRVRRGVVRLAS